MRRGIIITIITGIIIILAVGIIVIFNAKPFDKSKVTKIHTDILAKTYTNTKDIAVIIDALNSSKPTMFISKKAKSYGGANFTIYYKDGRKKNIKIYMMCGDDGVWTFADNPSRKYKIKRDEVDKLYNLLKIL